jgi:TP901-1 family phage major tail protein
MAGIINGSVYLLKIAGAAFPDQTEGSISLSMETRDTTSKDSSGFRELLESTRSGSISVSGLVDEATGQAVSTLMTHFAARSSFAIIFGLDDEVDNHFTCGSAFVTSIEASGGTEDNVTYSATIELSGAIAFVEL